MKKILLLFAFIFAFVPLFATVTISDSVPKEYRESLEAKVKEMTEGRRDTDVVLKDFRVEEDKASFSLRVGEETMETTVPISFLYEEVGNMLKYSSPLFLPAPTLDYAEDGFYSTSTFPEIKKGDLLWLLDGEGKKEGLFSVLSVHGENGELESVYLGRVLPGMKLEKAMGFNVFLLSALDLKSKAILSSLSLDFHTPLYPFLPSIGLAVENGNGITGIYGEMGVKVSFSPLSLATDMWFLKNFSLDAGAYLLLGSKGGFDVSGFWNASLSYRVTPSLFLSLGYSRSKGSGDMISISAGGTL